MFQNSTKIGMSWIKSKDIEHNSAIQFPQVVQKPLKNFLH